MPTYIYDCEPCENDREVIHSMKECDTHAEVCEHCGLPMTRVVQGAGLRIMAHNWEYLNGGRGQYISQLEPTPNGKHTDAAHVRSMPELYEKAARAGFDVHRIGF